MLFRSWETKALDLAGRFIKNLEVEVRDLLGGGLVDSAAQDSIDDTTGILDGDALAGAVPAGVDPAILDPRDTYKDAAEWETKAVDLASRFIKNFAKYEGNEHGKALVAAGPKL